MDYINDFLLYLMQNKNVSDNTLSAYAGDIGHLVSYLNEKRGKAPEIANNADIAAYMMSLRSDGRSASTVNRRMSAVRLFFSFLAEKHIIEENPALGIKSAKVSDRSLEYLTVEEVNRLLDISPDDTKSIRDKAMLELMYATGMRANEISGANLSDVNLFIGYISCSSEHKTRIIPIGRPAREALSAYIDGQRSLLLRGDENNDALFLNIQGQRMTRQGIWKIMKYYGQKAGIEKNISPQILRSSFAVHLLQNGADLKSVQELLGIEDINAAKLYLAATKNRIMDVYDKAFPRA